MCGGCRFKGCEYNQEGNCTNENDDFLETIEEIITNTDIDDKNTYIDCTIDVPNGYCECGSLLSSTLDSVPLGDATVPLTTYYCPTCD